jgi:hypothetical protein
MLVLGVGSLAAGSAAWQRIAETLVGAAVGVAANLLFPPKVATADAGQAINDLADKVNDLLRRAAAELDQLVADGRDVAPASREWLDDARRITHDIPQVGAVLLHAEQSRRLNVRAVGTADVGPGLRQGLEALEHAAVGVRSMFRAVADAVRGAAWRDDEGTDWVLPGLAQVFRELAAGVDAFGQLVQDEASAAARPTSPDSHALSEALEGMHEARARVEEVVVSGPAPDLLELHAVVLATIKRLLRELDLDERIRRQVRLAAQQRSRPRRPHAGGRADAERRPGTARVDDPMAEAETQQLPIVPDRPGQSPDPPVDRPARS